MNEDEANEPTTEDLVEMLHDAELLAEEGYRITPKGHIALVLMEHGFPSVVSGALAEIMVNRIFDAGWTIISEETLRGLTGGTDAL